MRAAPLASVSDYRARFGDVEDEGRLAAMLEDASAMMLSAYLGRFGRPYREGDSSRFDLNARAVCCAVVSRSLSAGAYMGVSQYTETAGSYSGSVTYANPSGDMYLSKSDLRRLGLLGSRARSVAAATAADRNGDRDA